MPTLETQPEEALDTALEGIVIFEAACQRYLKMSTDEFLEKWGGGYFQSHPSLAGKASDVALLLPLVRAR